MYLLIEQILNGTVTMQIVTTGIQAETWDEAVRKVKTMRNMQKATIQVDTNQELVYAIWKQKYPCHGRMENKLLEVI